MRKNLTILFFITFLTFGTEFSQVLRLPLLISHFIEHNTEENSTLEEFFIDHYLISHDNDGDKTKDENLPFKVSSSSQSLNLISFESQLESHKLDISTPSNFLLPKDDNFKQSMLSNAIWNPPKQS